MSRPNSHSITKATDFVKQLFKKDAQAEITTQQEVEPAQTLKLSDRDSSKKDKKIVEKYHRADTNIGIMNKFILQFSRVEQAYREIEKAFLSIAKSESNDLETDKMKRKCEVKYIRPILEYLGYPQFSNDELKQIFNKDVNADDQITFKRLLVGSGLCYYEKQPKKTVENWKPRSKKKANNNSTDNASDYDTDDEKVIATTPSIDEDELIVDPSAARRRRFRHIQQGFDVVQKMFNKIDEDASGEITHQEFKQAFQDVCRDPEIVEARMAELDYNKDEEITFREFIFGIASWVGFNDPQEDKETKDNEAITKQNSLKNREQSGGNPTAVMVDNHSNDLTTPLNGKNSNNNSNANSNGNNNSNDNNSNNNTNNTNNDSNNGNGGNDNNDNDDNNNNNDEPTVTETEDASFMNKTDKESNIEKTYIVVSPKASDAAENSSQGKDKDTSMEKSASKSNEISQPPPGYMD